MGNFSWATVHIWALMWQQCVQRRTGAGVLGHFLPTEAEKEVGDQTGCEAEGQILISDQRAALSVSRRDGGEACPRSVHEESQGCRAWEECVQRVGWGRAGGGERHLRPRVSAGCTVP